MKLIKPLLLGFSLLAFAGAYAADEKKNDTKAKPSMSESKSSPSAGSASAGASGTTNAKGSTGASSGSSTMAERMNFDKADKNKDGQLSREEFNQMMGGSGSAPSSAGKSTSGTSASGAGASTSGASTSGAGTSAGSKAKDKK